MMIFKIGPDNPWMSEEEELELKDKFEWVVIWYEDMKYEGRGEAVAFGKDGLLYAASLSHCSCYGPLCTEWKPVTLEEYCKPQEEKTVFDEESTDLIKSKVLELLAARR
jgi:hypothetical protein